MPASNSARATERIGIGSVPSKCCLFLSVIDNKNVKKGGALACIQNNSSECVGSPRPPLRMMARSFWSHTFCGPTTYEPRYHLCTVYKPEEDPSVYCSTGVRHHTYKCLVVKVLDWAQPYIRANVRVNDHLIAGVGIFLSMFSPIYARRCAMARLPRSS